MADGAAFLSPKVARHVIDGFGARRTGRRATARTRVEALTPREREVLGLMAQGLTNVAIAKSLTVSDGAVEKHVGNIFSKLGLEPSTEEHRRVRAVLTFLERG